MALGMLCQALRHWSSYMGALDQVSFLKLLGRCNKLLLRISCTHWWRLRPNLSKIRVLRHIPFQNISPNVYLYPWDSRNFINLRSHQHNTVWRFERCRPMTQIWGTKQTTDVGVYNLIIHHFCRFLISTYIRNGVKDLQALEGTRQL